MISVSIFLYQVLVCLVLFLLGTSAPARKHNSSYYDYDHHLQHPGDRQHVLWHDQQYPPPRNKLLVIVLDG